MNPWKRAEGECGKCIIAELITKNFSLLKKNCKENSMMSYKPKAGIYRENYTNPHWDSSA